MRLSFLHVAGFSLAEKAWLYLTPVVLLVAMLWGPGDGLLSTRSLAADGRPATCRIVSNLASAPRFTCNQVQDACQSVVAQYEPAAHAGRVYQGVLDSRLLCNTYP